MDGKALAWLPVRFDFTQGTGKLSSEFLKNGLWLAWLPVAFASVRSDGRKRLNAKTHRWEGKTIQI